MAQKLHRGNDTDALLPDGAAVFHHVVQHLAVLVEEPDPENLVTGEIHQVPVVHVLEVRQVEADVQLLQSPVALGGLEKLHQREQSSESQLVVFGCNADLQLIERDGFPTLFDDFAHHRHLDAEELIALAILTLAGLEETAQVLSLLGVLAVEDFLVKGNRVTCIVILIIIHIPMFLQ